MFLPANSSYEDTPAASITPERLQPRGEYQRRIRLRSVPVSALAEGPSYVCIAAIPRHASSQARNGKPFASPALRYRLSLLGSASFPYGIHQQAASESSFSPVFSPCVRTTKDSVSMPRRSSRCSRPRPQRRDAGRNGTFSPSNDGVRHQSSPIGAEDKRKRLRGKGKEVEVEQAA